MQIVVVAFGRVLDFSIGQIASDGGDEHVVLDGPSFDLAPDDEGAVEDKVPFGFSQ